MVLLQLWEQMILHVVTKCDGSNDDTSVFYSGGDWFEFRVKTGSSEDLVALLSSSILKPE